MRALTVGALLIAVIVLVPGTARAQSEDEQILEPEPAAPAQEGTTSEEPKPRQSAEDDEIDDEELDERVFYSGFGLERVGTTYENLGEATNLQAVIGFRVPTATWFGLEIDIGQTIIPGEYRDPETGSPALPPGCGGPLNPCTTPAQPGEDGAFDAAGDEFAMQALGLGLVLKSTGRFYATGRYGYRYIATSNDTLNEKRSGNGFGVGVGYRWGRGLSGVELGYKQLADDVDSIGLVFFVRSSRR